MPAASQEQFHKRSPFEGFLPFFWLALACIGGILLADALELPVWLWFVGVGLSFAAWLITLFLPERFALTHYLRQWTRAEMRLPGTILVMIFLLGGGRYAASQDRITPDHVAFYNERGYVALMGTLIEPPDSRDHQINLTIRVTGIRFNDEGTDSGPFEVVEGLVLAQVTPGRVYHYGDKLLVTGHLETPFEGADFSYRDYLARKGIHSIIPYASVKRLDSGGGNPVKALLFRIRDQGFSVLQAIFPAPESDLLAGILLGQDQGLSPQLQEDFRRTGTTHIIAISGFNMAILAGLFSGVFTRLFGRKWGALAAVLGISGFTILVGGEAAVVRAAIMGCVGVLGGMFGRRQNGLNSLGLAGLGMMLVNPNVLWDIGFQLSAAATLGLILYAQPLEEWFVRVAKRTVSEEQAEKWVGPVSEFFLFTLAAQVMTLPISAYHFGGISWMALIANPLILPLQSLVLILGGLAMLAGMILPGLGVVMANLALPSVRYTVRMVTWLGNLPGGEFALPVFHALWLILFYGLLFLFTLFPSDKRKSFLSRVFSYQSGALVLLGLVVFVWNRVLTLPDDNLHLTLLDAEGSILVQAPGGQAILLGGGMSPSKLRQDLGQMLPAEDPSLDVLIVGSAARDDLNGLMGILGKYAIETALWGIDPEANQTSRTVYQGLLEEDVFVTYMEAGQHLDLAGEIALDVLWVGERGAVLWLEWSRFSALLPTGKVENAWVNPPAAPDILLLPDDLSAEEFPLQILNSWSPSVILLPLAESDLPLGGEHALERLLQGYPSVSTLNHGWVRVMTDGEHIWVQGER